jgi:hypothetical protein
MKCPKCGCDKLRTGTEAGSTYDYICKRCGERFDESEEEVEPQPAPEVPAYDAYGFPNEAQHALNMKEFEEPPAPAPPTPTQEDVAKTVVIRFEKWWEDEFKYRIPQGWCKKDFSKEGWKDLRDCAMKFLAAEFAKVREAAEQKGRLEGLEAAEKLAMNWLGDKSKLPAAIAALREGAK